MKLSNFESKKFLVIWGYAGWFLAIVAFVGCLLMTK